MIVAVGLSAIHALKACSALYTSIARKTFMGSKIKLIP